MQTLHCFVRFIICDTTFKFDYALQVDVTVPQLKLKKNILTNAVKLTLEVSHTNRKFIFIVASRTNQVVLSVFYHVQIIYNAFNDFNMGY